MREIKFRAWDKISGSMNYKPCFNVDWGSFNLNLAFKDSKIVADDPEYYEFMQYTGLKDNNGVEIYEGDIVKDSRIWVVGFNEHYASFGRRDPSLGKNSTFIGGLHPYHKTFEVIGNIYENPELLK